MSCPVTTPDTRAGLAAVSTERGFRPGWGISLPELLSRNVRERQYRTAGFGDGQLCGEDPGGVGTQRSFSLVAVCGGGLTCAACVPWSWLALEQTVAVPGSCSDPGSRCPVTHELEARIVWRSRVQEVVGTPHRVLFCGRLLPVHF